jgi:biopolymer transport protein ExbD
MQFRTKRRDEPVVEIAPMIDVVFLLLLFFMVTTQFISMPGLKLTLPGITPGNNVTATDRVEVKVTAAGDIYINGDPVPEAGLVKALKEAATDPESAVVVLMADEKVTHGRIVALMDVIRNAGLKRVVLAARWKKDSEPKEAP